MIGVNTDIPQLKIELLASGCIRLENNDCGVSYAVDIHPTQLRYLAEKAGLIRDMCAIDADLMRRIATLKRRMLVLKTRIKYLGSYLCVNSDSEHADLSYEQGYAIATADICDEFCADLDEM